MSGGTVYIVLFRGVGGKTQLPVAPLREKLALAGFENVATYINSGNAVVRSALPRREVVEKVAEICAREFAFDKAIYAVARAKWTALIANNPFPDAVDVPKFLHAAILDGDPPEERLAALRDLAGEGDRLAVVNRVAYLHTPGGLSQSKLGEKFDKGIGVPNTARNWNTVLKLAELAAAADA